jgi:hypothetical protein
MDDLSEFLDRNDIQDFYGSHIEGFRADQAFIKNVPYNVSQLSIDEKKAFFDLGTVDRVQLIEMTCEKDNG